MRPLHVTTAVLLLLAGCASSNDASSNDESPPTDDPSHTDEPTQPVDPAESIDIPGVDEDDDTDPLADRRKDDDAESDASTPEPSRPDEADDGADVSTRDIEIPTDDLTLKGTLHVPATATDDPAPAVVLLHGSGPLSRDSAMSGQFLTAFGFETPIFREIADTLATDGYVVLRYDKRTCHGDDNARCEDNGYPVPSADVTVDDFADDASHALDWLADRGPVDGDRLVLLGHSQGGTLVPGLMDDHDAVAAGLLVATPHRPIDTTYRAQVDFMREMLTKSGMSDDQIRAMEPYQRITHVADQLAKLRDDNYDDDRLAGADTGFWRAWMQMGDDAPELAADLDRPLLILAGRYDFNVLPAELARWRQTLSADDGPNHRLAPLDCVTHALNCIDESNPFDVRPSDLGRHVHPSVTTTLTDFLDSTVPAE